MSLPLLPYLHSDICVDPALVSLSAASGTLDFQDSGINKVGSRLMAAFLSLIVCCSLHLLTFLVPTESSGYFLCDFMLFYFHSRSLTSSVFYFFFFGGGRVVTQNTPQCLSIFLNSSNILESPTDHFSFPASTPTLPFCLCTPLTCFPL